MSPAETSPIFWKTVLDIMKEGLMLVQSGGTILFVNRAMEILTGYAREELVGKTCALLDFDCCPRDGKPEERGPCPLFRHGNLANKHCSLRRKDGAHLAVLKNAQVIRDEQGSVVCAVEVQSDLTALEAKEREISKLRGIVRNRHGFHGIIGASPQMENLFDLVRKAARSEAPVLVYGESGTGKELVAEAIHTLGNKSKGPFIRVNCAALSESLLESELFGHVKGAFTGADRTTKGRFEAAHNGDVFLDEVGDVPLSTQVKLLRVIQEKEFERVGDYRTVEIDVRIIAASNQDLKALMREGKFREDLFYRLNVIPVHVPPLRERSGDVPFLITHFMREAAARTGKHVISVERDAMDFLTRYPWPGNVRELINVVEYAFVVCNGSVITRRDLPEMALTPGPTPLTDDEAENDAKDRLIQALIANKGKRCGAARSLGVSRQTVWSWIRKYGIDVKGLCSQ